MIPNKNLELLLRQNKGRNLLPSLKQKFFDIGIRDCKFLGIEESDQIWENYLRESEEIRDFFSSQIILKNQENCNFFKKIFNQFHCKSDFDEDCLVFLSCSYYTGPIKFRLKIALTYALKFLFLDGNTVNVITPDFRKGFGLDLETNEDMLNFEFYFWGNFIENL